MAFDPFTPGSPVVPRGVHDIHRCKRGLQRSWCRLSTNVWPGNETIETWLNGLRQRCCQCANAKIKSRNAIAHSCSKAFGTSTTRTRRPEAGRTITATAEWFYNFWTSLGFDPSNNPAPYDFSALVGTFTPDQLNGDWTALVNVFDPAAHGNFFFFFFFFFFYTTGFPWEPLSIPHRWRRNGRQCWPGSVCSRARRSPRWPAGRRPGTGRAGGASRHPREA